MTPQIDRRTFLGKTARGLGATALLHKLVGATAFAQSPSAYKAIVCIFLEGGNDGNNTLVPMDGHYAEYAQGRPSLAIPQNTLLSLNAASSGRLFGLHPSMRNVASLFNRGKAAWIANTGTLLKPITKADLAPPANGQAPVPFQLYNHLSQRAEWQSAITQGSSSTGWGGRLADTLAGGLTPSSPTIISTAGWSLLGTGSVTTAASTGVGANTVVVMNALQPLISTVQALECSDGTNTLQEKISTLQASYIATTKQINSAFTAGSALSTTFPSTSIGQQLQAIAQLIKGRRELGSQQQMFYANIAGYDTHSNQINQQGSNLSDLDGAIGAFASEMQVQGLFNEVTTFTMTDFARQFIPNSIGGSDHAWGNHQLVVGGAVRGGEVYGTFPSLALGGDDDALANGVWIPKVGASQYVATLARWLGVSTANLNTIFPELSNFPAQTLGFL